MGTPTDGQLRVPGASLHWEVRGAGPPLMILQSGDGNASRTKDLVDQLERHYRVVTYDRRGLSRSRPDDPGASVSVATHADDAGHLLSVLADEPALLLGCSFGAVLALELAARCPHRVGALIAHDPAAPGLLPEPERAGIRRLLAGIHATYRQDGWRRAMEQTAAATGIDPARMEVEEGVAFAPLDAGQVADREFFLANDIPALADSAFGSAGLACLQGTDVVPAVGRTSQGAWNYRCAVELAAHLGVELVEFSGGHNGNTTHPRAFAARVRETFERVRGTART